MPPPQRNGLGNHFLIIVNGGQDEGTMMHKPDSPADSSSESSSDSAGAPTPLKHPANLDGGNAALVRPSPPQRRYLARGLSEPGGKLPLFDRDGQAVARKTVESCIERGWAEPWAPNPVKPDWLVCRLTAAGRQALMDNPPAAERIDPSEL